jgi:hypothetical protein
MLRITGGVEPGPPVHSFQLPASSTRKCIWVSANPGGSGTAAGHFDHNAVMGARRWSAWGYGLGGALALVLAVVLGRRALLGGPAGNVDPVAAVLGLVSLAASIWAGRLAVRALRWQETDLADAAVRLAVAVLAAEQEARRAVAGRPRPAIDMAFTFHPVPAHNAEGAADEGSLAEVVRYYRDLRPGRLVVTGAPGAGKTVLVVELMLACWTAARRRR